MVRENEASMSWAIRVVIVVCIAWNKSVLLSSRKLASVILVDVSKIVSTAISTAAVMEVLRAAGIVIVVATVSVTDAGPSWALVADVQLVTSSLVEGEVMELSVSGKVEVGVGIANELPTSSAVIVVTIMVILLLSSRTVILKGAELVVASATGLMVAKSLELALVSAVMAVGMSAARLVSRVMAADASIETIVANVTDEGTSTSSFVESAPD